MKAKIGELEVEGTPAEIAVLARLIAKTHESDGRFAPNRVASLEEMPPSKEGDKTRLQPMVHRRWPQKPHCSHIRRGMPVRILADMIRKNPAMHGWSEQEIGEAYIKETGISGYNKEGFPKNLRKAFKLARRKENFMEIATRPHYKRIELRGRQPYSFQKIADMMRQNPGLVQKPVKEIYKAYIGHDAFPGSHFRGNLRKAIEQLNAYPADEKVSSGAPKRKGRPLTVKARLLMMFNDNPSLADKSVYEICRLYYKNPKTKAGQAFYEHVKDAKSEFNAAGGLKESPSSGTEQRGIVRSFEYGHIRRNLMDELVRKMPGTFTMRDMLRAASNRLGISPTDKMRWVAMNKAVHSALHRRSDVQMVSRTTEAGLHGRINVYEKIPESSIAGRRKPISIKGVDAALHVAPVDETTEVEQPSLKEAAEFNPMIISKATLDMIIENHMSFGADVLVGLKSKTGVTLTENDAIFAFRHLVENIGGLAAAYPHKHFRISGTGRYKVIEMR